jgi:hypothetical protein
MNGPTTSLAGSPLGSPFGSRDLAALPPVRARLAESRVPKAPAVSPVSPRRPLQRPVVGPRQRHRLAESLAERDWEILERVAEHRFLSSPQIQRFVFHGHSSEVTAARTTRRVLGRLERDGLIAALPRRQGGPMGGSTPAVWQLAPAGARLLSEGINYRTRIPTTRFLAHCLAVADTHLAIRATAAGSGWAWAVQVEQLAARPYLGSAGEPQVLRPDLHARLTGEDEHGAFEDAWFIEVDLGTESLPTVLRKCAQYEAYRRRGIEQAEHGSFPLVLWLFTTHARADELASRVRRTPSLTPALYRYALLEPGAIQAVLSGATDESGENGGAG